METAATTLGAELDARLLGLYWLVGRASDRDMSRTAASVLATLRDDGPKRITELAASELIAQPSVTTLVARLERDGLVRREPDPADARAVRVHLTGEGRERLARLRANRAAALDARLAGLTPEERKALGCALPALDKLIHEETTR
jgi:DNA-binding MarR family transcriptional regulator